MKNDEQAEREAIILEINEGLKKLTWEGLSQLTDEELGQAIRLLKKGCGTITI